MMFHVVAGVVDLMSLELLRVEVVVVVVLPVVNGVVMMMIARHERSLTLALNKQRIAFWNSFYHRY